MRGLAQLPRDQRELFHFSYLSESLRPFELRLRPYSLGVAAEAGLQQTLQRCRREQAWATGDQGCGDLMSSLFTDRWAPHFLAITCDAVLTELNPIGSALAWDRALNR